MPRFNAILKINVTIDATTKEEADKILDRIDVIAFIRGTPVGQRTLRYKIDYPTDIFDWKLEE